MSHLQFHIESQFNGSGQQQLPVAIRINAALSDGIALVLFFIGIVSPVEQQLPTARRILKHRNQSQRAKSSTVPYKQSSRTPHVRWNRSFATERNGDLYNYLRQQHQ